MEINPDLIMQFGLMQKLSTGNNMLDAVLVMLLPLLFSRVIPFLQEQWEKFNTRSAPNIVRREIAFTFKADRYFDYDGDIPPNHKLQTAILVHLNTLPEFQTKLVNADVKLVKAPKGKQQQLQDGQEGLSLLDEDDASSCSSSESDDYSWYPDMELENFEIKVVPPMDETITLEPGLTFCRSQKTATTGDGTTKSDETTVVFTLESHNVKQIDDFISAAYESYRTMIKGDRAQQGPEQRYLYLPVLSGSESGKEGDFTFRSYPLTDDKDFSNFFHPDKDNILQLVESFSNKTGKFAIKGYPQKLGFLLHGPPGTGKTTFLKALACHTGRPIINIPLSRIRTNQQLMSLMMDQQVRVEGDDYCRPLPHSKVIYVCEDVDAASHVVQKRGLVDPVTAALSSIMLPGAAPHHTAAAATPSADANSRGTGNKVAAKPTDTTATPNPKYMSSIARAKMFALDHGSDELNLAGLLNVLDGVVDTPGRLLVLSTNHPEMLDPALIRPGRINRQVYMSHMARNEALQLVTHYFNDITPKQQEAFTAVWQDGCVSPAALEALCAECEDVDSLVKGVTVLISHCDVGPQEHDVIGVENDVMQRDQGEGSREVGDVADGSEGKSERKSEGKSGSVSEDGHARVSDSSSASQAEGLTTPDEAAADLFNASSSGSSSNTCGGCDGLPCVDQAAGDADAVHKDACSKTVMLQASSCFAELARVFAADGTAAAATAAANGDQV